MRSEITVQKLLKNRKLYHFESWVHHLRHLGQVQPNLKELECVWPILMDQWEHLSMYNTFTRSHPLQITLPVTPSISTRIGVVNQSIHSCRDGLKSSMWMLYKFQEGYMVIYSIQERNLG